MNESFKDEMKKQLGELLPLLMIMLIGVFLTVLAAPVITHLLNSQAASVPAPMAHRPGRFFYRLAALSSISAFASASSTTRSPGGIRSNWDGST